MLESPKYYQPELWDSLPPEPDPNPDIFYKQKHAPCVCCGEELEIATCGVKAPCPTCKTLYPHGGCSD